MNEYQNIRREIVLKYLEDYPGTPSNTLSRMILKDNPLIFKDVEDARNKIRFYRGQKGEVHRKSIKTRKYLTYEQI